MLQLKFVDTQPDSIYRMQDGDVEDLREAKDSSKPSSIYKVL